MSTNYFTMSSSTGNITALAASFPCVQMPLVRQQLVSGRHPGRYTGWSPLRLSLTYLTPVEYPSAFVVFIVSSTRYLAASCQVVTLSLKSRVCPILRGGDLGGDRGDRPPQKVRWRGTEVLLSSNI